MQPDGFGSLAEGVEVDGLEIFEVIVDVELEGGGEILKKFAEAIDLVIVVVSDSLHQGIGFLTEHPFENSIQYPLGPQLDFEWFPKFCPVFGMFYADGQQFQPLGEWILASLADNDRYAQHNLVDKDECALHDNTSICRVVVVVHVQHFMQDIGDGVKKVEIVKLVIDADELYESQ
jgi:hypothetical protein